ncbi:MAG: hypothetical protein IT459_09670 [Planctomycetes bacterium]|nr:hypothetical protein [Planctomycetota bacterium]
MKARILSSAARAPRSPSTLGALGALALVLSLSACGSKSAKELADAGYQDLGRSDYQAALTKFQEALKQTDAASPDYVSFKFAEIEAWTGIDGEKAKAEFLDLAAKHRDAVTAKDYVKVANKLTGAKSFASAIALLDDGLKRYPDDANVKQLGHLIKAEAEKAGDKNALSSLAGLGYL